MMIPMILAEAEVAQFCSRACIEDFIFLCGGEVTTDQNRDVLGGLVR